MGTDVIKSAEKVSQIFSQVFFYLRGSPHIKESFLTFTVSIFGSVKTPLRSSHVTQNVSKDLSCHFSMAGLTRCLVRLSIRHSQHGLIVKHLLEMGHQPPFVNGVPTETVTDMIKDATISHIIECFLHHA